MSDIGKADSSRKLFEEFSAPSKEEWKKQVIADLKGTDFDTLAWNTYEGFRVDPLYVRDDISSLSHLDSLPGFDPYVRGTDPLGSADHPWLISQVTAEPLVEDAAKEIVHAREHGQNCISLKLDRAAIMALGIPEAFAKTGIGGTAIQHINDFQVITTRLQPRVPFDIYAGMSSPIYLAMAAANDRCLAHVDFSPLAHMISEGNLPYSVETTFTLLRDAIRYVDKRSLPTTVISVCGECYHNAGANAAQELACMLASGVEYMHQLTDMGLSPDAIAQRIRFNFPVGMSFFMEIAKLRAARLLWARVTDMFEVKDADARKMRMHVRTSWWHQTKYDPYVNMLRTTIESMAGVIGGAESMYTAPFDEVAGTPGVFSRRVARNLQIVLREEAHLGQVADPAAGSYYIETLTDSLARRSWQIFQEIEAQGGYLAAVKSGFIQGIIEKTAAEKKTNISRRRDVIVGSNHYPNLSEKPLVESVPDPAAIAEQLTASRERHCADRGIDAGVLMQSLREVLRSGSGNLIAAIAGAVEEGLTVAEINDVLRNGGGDIPSLHRLRPSRAAEGFELLRDAVSKADKKPRAFLATYGPGFWRRARATFASGFFGTAGIEVLDNPGFETPAAAAEAALSSGADILVACSDDESYPKLMPEMIAKIHAADSRMIIVVAGYPKDDIAVLEKAGVELFIHVKSDVGATLTQLLQRLGIVSENDSEVQS